MSTATQQQADEESIRQRLTELEIKAVYTEDLLDTLNAMVARQQEAIEMLVRELSKVRESQASADAGARSLRDELPPHY